MQRLVRIGGKKAEVLGRDGGDAGVDESAWSIGQLRLHATDEILVEQVPYEAAVGRRCEGRGRGGTARAARARERNVRVWQRMGWATVQV